MKRARKPKWSFVVMRGADKSVKQFSVSKRSVVAVPAAAVLAVSGCFAGLQIKSAYQTKELREELKQQSAAFSQTVSVKDEAIVTLQQEILRLSRQAQEMNTKVEELQELESKLKLFIEKYGDRVDLSAAEAPNSAKSGVPMSGRLAPASADSAASTTPPTDLSIKRMANLAYSTGLDLKSMKAMVDTMDETLAQTLQRAVALRAAVDAYPSGWPTESKVLTSGFGYRRDPFSGSIRFHAGIDIAGDSSDPVFSAADGTVVETGYGGSEGNYIVVDHGNGFKTVYMHLEEIGAAEGDYVLRSEKIGLMGSTGRSTGYHLHFQIMQKEEPVNPIGILKAPFS